MINVTCATPYFKLNKVKIGDEITDEYENRGKVIKINKSKSTVGREYLFYLDNKQTVYILSGAI